MLYGPMRLLVIDESSEHRSTLAGYQPIVGRLLAKQPHDRYQSARDLFASIAI